MRFVFLFATATLIVTAVSAPPLSGEPLGTVRESPDACPAGAGPVARTTCRQVVVECPGLKDLQAQLRITEAASGKPLRGTVVLGSGGNGAGFYGSQKAGQLLAGELAAMGFQVVDRAWDGGWPTREGGLKKEACRYATLLSWIHGQIHTGGKFVATGNSGGSAEIGYALTTYGRGDILDVAIPTSGPPVARLDFACVTEASPEWAKLCASIVPPGVMECTPACVLGTNNGVCKQVTPEPTAAQLLEDSVVHPGAVLDYPKTRMYFLFGALDCGEPVPNGLIFANQVTSEKVIQFVPQTPHALASTAEGREAIGKAIDLGTSEATAAPSPPAAPAAPWSNRTGDTRMNCVSVPTELIIDVIWSRNACVAPAPSSASAAVEYW
jgi:hypothetical protein